MKVFVNGTFDLVHRGHLELLAYAASLGSVLVAIDADSRVKQLKGDDRPIMRQEDRWLLLSSLRTVERAVIFRTDEQLEDIIREHQPDIMVKGSDYKDKPIIGSQHCKKIVFFDLLEQHSTTKMIQAIKARNQ